MVRLFILCSLLILSTYSFAQSDTIFEKVFYHDTYGVSAKSITSTPEDGAILLSTIEYQNSTISKVDSAGTILWNKTLSSSSSMTYPGLRLERVISNSDSAYSAVGINYNENSNKLDLCVLRFNSDGDTLWSRHFNQSASSHFNGSHIIESVDSSLLVTGFNEANSHSFVIKLDFDGNLLWKKELYTTNGSKITSITQAVDSIIYIGGWGQTGPNPPFSFVAAFEHTGNPLWSKEFSGFILNDIYHRDSALFIVGYGNNAVSMIRMEEDGSAVNWANSYMLSGSNDNSERMELTPLSNGDLATLNQDQFFSTALIRISPNGTLTQFLPMTLDGCALVETNKKGHMVLGSGPLIGIHSLQQSHLGLIRMDSLYSSGECYGFQMPNQQALNLTLTNFTWSISDDLNEVTSIVVIDETNFVEYYGCVQIFGSLNELAQLPLVNISPNPASDFIEFKQPEDLPMSLRITDLMGRIVFQSENASSNLMVDLSTFEEATYIYRATFDNNEFTTGKFMVKR